LAIGGGIGGVIVLVLTLLFGGNPSDILNGGGGQPAAEQGTGASGNTAAQDEQAQFVSVVLKDTEDVWNKLFREQLGQDYREPTLVLFSGRDQSGCGTATAATGPFYCPADQKVYIDLSFYDQLRSRFQAPGDFAMAYVIAHEVGHHIQNQLGISGQVHQQQQQLGKAEANALSVRLELQADFLAGVWAHHAQEMKNILETGDIEEALGAANATTGFRWSRRATWCPTPSRTAPPSSGCTGSRRASRRETSTRAIRSKRVSKRLCSGPERNGR
jgi:predicted metalloprotease